MRLLMIFSAPLTWYYVIESCEFPTGCAVLLVMFHSEIAIAIESSEVASHGIVAAIVLASQPSALKHPH